ncbi:MAG: hypothetical protein LWW86_07640 [Micrococcales bacterium]|nr:hypothetical protein [Micrococcales bacterium]
MLALTASTGAALTALVAAGTLLRSLASGGAAQATADELLARLCGTAGLLVLAWLAGGTALALLEGLRSGQAPREPRRGIPRVCLRLAATILGAGAVLGPVQAQAAAPPPAATAAQVAGPPTPAPTPTPAELAAVPDPGFGSPAPGWTPQAPPHRPQADHRLVTSGRGDRERTVVVRRGDCLWSIVERALGPSAGDAEVARAVPRWHAANRETIGADPDRLLPGQVLRPPTGAAR